MQLELPNNRTRVGWLIHNMKECPDKDVSAALATIGLDDGAAGMRIDFEIAVAFLLTQALTIGRIMRQYMPIS